jgi:hypothetical protein
MHLITTKNPLIFLPSSILLKKECDEIIMREMGLIREYNMNEIGVNREHNMNEIGVNREY